MKAEDILALAALAGGIYGLKKAGDVDKSLEKTKSTRSEKDADKDYVDLRTDGSPDPYPEKKRVSPAELKASGESLRDELSREEYGAADLDRLKRARLKAIREEPTLRRAITSSSGMPVRSGSGFAKSGQYKKGGAVKTYAKGGSVSSASKRADGCAQRGKTKGRIV